MNFLWDTGVPIKIRAHHLLCLQGFQGYGYSRDFEVNMYKIISLVNTTSGLEIEVVAVNDVICACCPYGTKTLCQKDGNSARRVRALDLEILKILGLEAGIQGKVQGFISMVNSRFKTKLQLERICGSCSWKKKCLWYMSRSD